LRIRRSAGDPGGRAWRRRRRGCPVSCPCRAGRLGRSRRRRRLRRTGPWHSGGDPSSPVHCDEIARQIRRRWIRAVIQNRNDTSCANSDTNARAHHVRAALLVNLAFIKSICTPVRACDVLQTHTTSLKVAKIWKHRVSNVQINLRQTENVVRAISMNASARKACIQS
jgi:hypothetical protein